MSLWKSLRRLVQDPPPEFAFELSEHGVAWARCLNPPQSGFKPLPPGVISVSPLRDNVLDSRELSDSLGALAPVNGKRRRAAVILPDFAARISVLDFDSFPSEPAEQLSLVRFRLKKAVPFDIEAAAVSFQTQPAPGGGKRVEVVAAVLSVEVLARYEAAFRAAGFHPGLVTISALPLLDLVRLDKLAVLARIAGRTLTVCVLDRGRLRLVRCVELESASHDEVLAVLFPTFAYVEDGLGARPDLLLLCGFGAAAETLRLRAGEELKVGAEQLRSRFGVPNQENAGLLGYLESVED